MKKLMIAIGLSLLIVSVGFSRSNLPEVDTIPKGKDTVCVPIKDAIKKAKQADSLRVAKQEISVLKNVVASQNSRLSTKDSVARELRKQLDFEKDISGSYYRESEENKSKFLKADARVSELNLDLRRQKTKTLITGGMGIVVTIITFLIASR
jgi:hypothetical protein